MIQLGRLILYGRNGKVRIVSFRQRQLNLISGNSKTGKSAIVDIIDYCLGSDRANIADGVIRDKVAYYAVVLAVDGREVFVCRQDPPANAQSSQGIWVLTGSDVGEPAISGFVANHNPDTLRTFLSELIGIGDNMSEPEAHRSSPPLVANFRHALMLCFQQQGEIAQRGFLFHECGDNFKALAARDTLPYFLGVVDDDRPLLRQQLRDAIREQRLAQRRVDEHVSIGGEGFARGLALLAEARNVGLLTADAKPVESQDVEVELRLAVEAFESDANVPDIASDELERIDSERQVRFDRVAELDEQLRQMRAVGRDEDGFAGEIREQQARLESINLFETPDGVAMCPLCGTNHSLPSTDAFNAAIEELRRELEGVEATKPRVESLIKVLSTERAAVVDQLRQLKLERDSVAAQHEELRRLADMNRARARTVGRISLYLDSGALNQRDDMLPLRQSLEAAKAKVEELEARLDESLVDDQYDSVQSIVNRDMTAMAAGLGLEYSGDFIRLDVNKLTIIADTASGPVPMIRMGSGENWVGYHLVAHLALHSWFVRKQRPVPRFLIFDQPSQVYFPSEVASDGSGEDWNSVRRMFRLMLERILELDGELQIIVMDHVNLKDDWFQDALIEEWREGRALVPSDW